MQLLIKWTTIILIGVSLTGCMPKAKSLTIKKYVLTAEQSLPHAGPSSSSAQPPLPYSLKVEPIQLNPVFNTVMLTYRMSHAGYERDYYHRFLSSPGLMISEAVYQALLDAHMTKSLLSPQSVGQSDYSLAVRVNSLYGDFQNKAEPKAIMNLTVILTQGQGRQTKQVFEKNYHYQAVVKERSASGVVKAWNEDLGTFSRQIIKELRASMLTHKATANIRSTLGQTMFHSHNTLG